MGDVWVFVFVCDERLGDGDVAAPMWCGGIRNFTKVDSHWRRTLVFVCSVL
jgi:hypothetical protein